MVRKKPICYKSIHTTQKNFWGYPPGPGWPQHPPRHPLRAPGVVPFEVLRMCYNIRNIITFQDSRTACNPCNVGKYCNFRT